MDHLMDLGQGSWSKHKVPSFSIETTFSTYSPDMTYSIVLMRLTFHVQEVLPVDGYLYLAVNLHLFHLMVT